MKPLVRPCLLAALLGIWLPGCSRDNPATAGAPSLEVAAMRAPDAQNPADVATIATDDPCKLLTDAEVQQTFPGTTPGRREHGLDQYGIATCQWDTPVDRFIVQMFKVESDTVEDELRSRASGSVDPLMRAASVRYITVAGVGDQAMSVTKKPIRNAASSLIRPCWSRNVMGAGPSCLPATPWRVAIVNLRSSHSKRWEEVQQSGCSRIRGRIGARLTSL